MNPVMETILERRSIRSYKPEQLTDEQTKQILDSGLWAPTARNEQEVQFVCVQKPEILEELKKDFSASIDADFRDFIYGAPTFVFLFGHKAFPFTDIDGGIAVENMALSAEALGLSSVIIGCICKMMAGPLGEKWFDRFGISKDNKFIIGLAVGTKSAETAKRDRNDGRISYF